MHEGHTLVIPAFWCLRQKGCLQFETSLMYIVRRYLKDTHARMHNTHSCFQLYKSTEKNAWMLKTSVEKMNHDTTKTTH